jgi:hypothetical protein
VQVLGGDAQLLLEPPHDVHHASALLLHAALALLVPRQVLAQGLDILAL